MTDESPWTWKRAGLLTLKIIVILIVVAIVGAGLLLGTCMYLFNQRR